MLTLEGAATEDSYQSGGILIPPFIVRIFKATVFLHIRIPLTDEAERLNPV
jgi:hypothetical protein